MKKMFIGMLVVCLTVTGCSNQSSKKSNEGNDENYYEENYDVTTTSNEGEAYESFSPEMKLQDDPQGILGERYREIHENNFVFAQEENTSTFGIDVDTASYANVRNQLMSGYIPIKDSVRIEEMVNYFSYDYPQPKAGQVFSLVSQTTETPWRDNTFVTMIGLQGKTLDRQALADSNIVMLLDVSGSMYDSNKLPLLKEAFGELVKNLTGRDRVSIVVYAGASGVVVEGVRGDDKDQLMAAINALEAGGSTAGSQGIEKAYELARTYYIPGGNNRVILATDGDFNVGLSSPAALEDFIADKAKDMIALSVVGFGRGNIRDDLMETLADRGDGNYAYIDSLTEAKKVFGEEFLGTMFTIAQDVKIQVEFNEDLVEKYRLIGYENRVMANEDFKDDSKDSGDLGAGHEVTALYELVLKNGVTPQDADLYDIQLRYKAPGQTSSTLVNVASNHSHYRPLDQVNDSLKWALAVTEFAMILRDSSYESQTDLDRVWAYVNDTAVDAYQKEFVDLLVRYKDLIGG